MKAVYISIVVAMAWVQLARAEEYVILSAGTQSCGSFVKGDAGTKEIYLSWGIGYISGANTRSSGEQRKIGLNWDRNSALLWLENFCTKDPLSTFHMAVEGLWAALATKQGAIKPQ
jgi:hypothetical protein